MALNLDPVTPTIGAVVSGIDLGQPLDTATRDALEAALVAHEVLFFRNQQITQPQQRDLAALFGPLHIHPIYPHSDS
ncbi:TauD/TfdA family dioxygenase, partial [Acinetobacter baumannii]